MTAVIAFFLGAVVAGAVAALALARSSRRRRQDRDEVEQRVQRAEQLAYAGTLAGGLIHEVKNPLNTLSMNLQLLAEDWRSAKTPEERRALKRIQLLQSETRRLTAILDEFLNFVRGHRLDLAECDVNELVDKVLTFVRPEMESKHLDVRKSYGTLPRCRLDADLIEQVLLNLLLNAEQAVGADENREIIVRTAPEDRAVRIDVIDTGKGIRPEDLDKIFEAFYSTRKGGSGLGLPTARRIVEEHGGSLVAHSEYGRGSCFSIKLPAQLSDGKGDDDRTEGTSTESSHERNG